MIEDGVSRYQKYVKIYKQRNDVCLVQWPAESPDLYLSEVLERDFEPGLEKTWGQIDDISTLKMCLKIIWGQIGEDRLLGLIHSMPEHVCTVIAAKGEHLIKALVGADFVD